MNSSLLKKVSEASKWEPGIAPVAVIMISLNEDHNLQAVLSNLRGWAQEVFLVDSFSKDTTVNVALQHGVHVVQRQFRGFGDQWNFAISKLPIAAPWTMKLDPDERLDNVAKARLIEVMQRGNCDGISMTRRLWFMGRPLPARHKLIRLWRTGNCRFTDVIVNEHPIIKGRVTHVDAEIAHHDSPDLDHWLEKQNRYTTAEAVMLYQGSALADKPRLLGNPLQRRMWLKAQYHHLPFRHVMFFAYCYAVTGAWRSGWVGYAWARLRADVMRLIDYKKREIELTGRLPQRRPYGAGAPDPRVPQYD
jgi:glycosyltransferase involved in cell wall biosynthesis